MSNGAYEKFLKEKKDDLISNLNANPYAKLGFLENPFPTKTHVLWKRFHNQKQVLKAYEQRLESFIRDDKTSSFLLLGGNRTGKTHFLMNKSQEIQESNREYTDFSIAPLYISASSTDFNLNYTDMLDQLESEYLDARGEPLLPELIFRVQNEPHKYRTAHLIEDDLIRAILRIPVGNLDSMTDGKLLRLKDREYDLTGFLKAWLRGASTPADFRQALNIFSIPKSASSKIHVFGSLIKLMKVYGLLGGVVLFVDELEQIWLSPYGKAKREMYLILLRALLDEFTNGGLFMVVALSSKKEYLDKFEEQYVPLFRRLVSPGEEYKLRQIDSHDDAWGYVELFRDEARGEYNKKTGLEFTAEEIITRDFTNNIIEQNEELSKFPIPQGNLFDSFHRAIEEIIGSNS